MRSNRIFALVVMVAGSLMAGVGVMNIQQVNATTNNNSIITEPGQGDFNVIVPPIENTINCALPSSLLNGGGDCIGTDRNDKMLPASQTHNVLGGPGDDYLLGGNIHDSLNGGAGNDLIYGSNGNDYIEGNEGEDRMFGGPGDDWINAGQESAIPPPREFIGNGSEWPPVKDFVDCGEGYDRIFVDYLDVHLNCELVNEGRPSMDTNRDISNLTRFLGNNTMDTNRDISNLTRFP